MPTPALVTRAVTDRLPKLVRRVENKAYVAAPPAEVLGNPALEFVKTRDGETLEAFLLLVRTVASPI